MDIYEEVIAIKINDEQWRAYEPDRAYDAVIAAEPSDILQGSLSSLRAAFEEQHPSEEPDASRVLIGQWGCIAIFDKPVFYDSQVVIDRLKAQGSGEMYAMFTSYYPKLDEGFSYSSSKFRVNTVLHPDTGESRIVYAISYDLASFKKEQKQSAIKDKKRLVTRDELWDVSRSITSLLNPERDRFHFTTFQVGDNLGVVVSDLQVGIELFNWLYGKNAHRQLDTFQDLKKSWANNVTKNEKKYGMEATFVNWMRDEIKIRKPRKRELVKRFKSMWPEVSSEEIACEAVA